MTLTAGAQTAAPIFRFHLGSAPASLRSWDQKNSNAGYLLSQVVGTLINYQDHQIEPNLAEKCEQKSAKLLKCTLRKDLQWSDGSPLTAVDFQRSFQQFLHPQNHAFRAELLFPVKNAEKIFKGELPANKLGLSIKNREISFELETPDSEFIYTLASPLLAPIPSTEVPTIEEIRANSASYKSSGAYQFESWAAQKKIVLKPNPYFWSKNFTRPKLEIVTISEDTVALSLYEKKELSFLRRLPTLFIPKYQGKPDYFEVDQFRFDYIGFAPQLQDEHLRLALVQSLNFPELQDLFHSHIPPGCVGIQEVLPTEKFCYTENLEQAKKEWKQISNPPTSLELFYSKQGGDDHQRSMEWAQGQWKKNLDLKVSVTALENKIFVDKIEKSPPDLFRKGVAPDRPTCLSALETFDSTGSENYLQFKNAKYDAILKKMKGTVKKSDKKKLCSEALHLLLDKAYLIPIGPIHFTLLVDPHWKGWRLNELNQLDLSQLRYQ